MEFYSRNNYVHPSSESLRKVEVYRKIVFRLIRFELEQYCDEKTLSLIRNKIFVIISLSKKEKIQLGYKFLTNAGALLAAEHKQNEKSFVLREEIREMTFNWIQLAAIVFEFVDAGKTSLEVAAELCVTFESFTRISTKNSVAAHFAQPKNQKTT
jgi:hypothetical protein